MRAVTPTTTRATAAAAAAWLLLALAALPLTAAEPPQGRYVSRDGRSITCSFFGCGRDWFTGSLTISRLAGEETIEPALRVDHFELRFETGFPEGFATTRAKIERGDAEGGWRLSEEKLFDFELLVPADGEGRWLLLRGVRFDPCIHAGCGAEIPGVLFERVDATPQARPLLLLDGRYEIDVEWRTREGDSGPGQPQPLGDRSGKFWFFRHDNPELLVKMVPACGPFGRNWFFAAGLTDVAVTIRVTDRETGAEKSYENPAGHTFAPIQDTAAFPCD